MHAQLRFACPAAETLSFLTRSAALTRPPALRLSRALALADLEPKHSIRRELRPCKEPHFFEPRLAPRTSPSFVECDVWKKAPELLLGAKAWVALRSGLARECYACQSQEIRPNLRIEDPAPAQLANGRNKARPPRPAGTASWLLFAHASDRPVPLSQTQRPFCRPCLARRLLARQFGVARQERDSAARQGKRQGPCAGGTGGVRIAKGRLAWVAAPAWTDVDLQGFPAILQPIGNIHHWTERSTGARAFSSQDCVRLSCKPASTGRTARIAATSMSQTETRDG